MKEPLLTSIVIDDPTEVERLTQIASDKITAHAESGEPSGNTPKAFQDCMNEISKLTSDYKEEKKRAIIPGSLPNLTAHQGYLESGKGLNIKHAWEKGAQAEGIRIHLIEQNFLLEHHDLRGAKISRMPPAQADNQHGTKVLGILAAQDNGFGITGIAHKASFDCYATDGGSRAPHLREIVKKARAGDIYLTCHATVNIINGKTEQVPEPCNISTQALYHSLARKGAICLFCLGNNELDYSTLVACQPPPGIAIAACNNESPSRRWIVPDHLKAEDATGNAYKGSSYNWPAASLNAWGEGVCTLSPQGDLYGGIEVYVKSEKCEALPAAIPTSTTVVLDTIAYTKDFGGTSAATPMVAGACALIQSYAMEKHNRYLDWEEMYALINLTGYSEAKGQGIGVRPNTLAAMEELDRKIQGGKTLTTMS